MRERTNAIMYAALLFLLSACSASPTEEQQEIANNIMKLQEMEAMDIAAVSAAVSDAQKQLARQQEDDADINYRDVFKNSVIMGDSIAAGLEEYGLLTSMQVVASRGRNLATIDDDIQTVIQIAPKDIFFSYGMNDLGYFNGNTEVFIERYKDIITTLQESLPKAVLHINAILPIQQHAIDENPLYANYQEFNDAMKKMCGELHIDFIDNSSIITTNQIPYNPDGIHPVYDFFPRWLHHMAERL